MAPARGHPTVPTYQKDEKALCFHHEFLYEAKVLDSRHADSSDKNSPMQYRVHYKGWKSTWDDWVPQDRLRKLTDENKQLATNLKRDLEEMPRAAAKSAKANKKKTAGSDLSSARGSEERQSLPPGRNLKRGRDNEIEKVGSSLSPSSVSFPLRRSERIKRASPDPEPMEPRKHRIIFKNKAIDVKSNYRSLPLLDRLEKALLYIDAVESTDNTADIDVEFWAEEAALLDIWTKEAAAKAVVQLASAPNGRFTTDDRKSISNNGPRSESYIPLNKLSDSAFNARREKMLKQKKKSIGKGADPPWPNGPPKGPERHEKWSYTMRGDSHNHAKLAFYADMKPTDIAVIAGFSQDNPPLDLARKSDVVTPPSKKRKIKAVQSNGAHSTTRSKRRRTRNTPSKKDKAPHYSLLEESRTRDDAAKHKDQGSKGSLKETPSLGIRQLAQPLQPEDLTLKPGMINQRPEIADSEEQDDTNEDLEQEDHFYARPAVKIEIPDHLKAILVDDWENVTKNLSLVPIPAEHPVSEILDTYFEEEKGKRRLGSAEADLLEEVVQGTRDYFDQCLGKLLLYRFEREQYFRLHKAMEAGKSEFDGRPLKNKKIADIYGAEHLCRLFVSLPELIAQTNMDAQAVSKLRQEIQALTAWLGKNSTRFFTAQYETAPQEYVEKAKGL